MHLSSLLTPAAAPRTIDTAQAWREQWLAQSIELDTPFELALRAGHQADRLSWAFIGGYQAALAAMLPSAPRSEVACLCATEVGGNQPKHIQARLYQDAAGQWRVSAHKRWSLAPAASRLWVLVRDERPNSSSAEDSHSLIDLKLVAVNTQTIGVRIEPMPPTSFMPELPHTELHLSDVLVNAEDVLPGDAYAEYVKPFRTLEDIYISVASLTHLLRTVQRHGWPASLAEDMLGLLHALHSLSQQAATAPSTHIALPGTLRSLERVYAALDEHTATLSDHPDAVAWRRDRKLFGAASRVRELRTQRAWERLTTPPQQATAHAMS